MGWPASVKAAVILVMRPASVFMAPAVVSLDIVEEGNDQMLPSGIAPKPLALRPSSVRTSQLTLKTVARVPTLPPNFRGVRST